MLRKLPLFGLSLASSLKLIGAWKTFAPAVRACAGHGREERARRESRANHGVRGRSRGPRGERALSLDAAGRRARRGGRRGVQRLRALLASAELFSSMPVSSMHSLTAPWSLPPSVVNCEQAGGGEVGGSVRPSLRQTDAHFVLVLNEEDRGLLGVHGGAALGLGGRECAISGHDCGRAARGHDRLLDDERRDGGCAQGSGS